MYNICVCRGNLSHRWEKVQPPGEFFGGGGKGNMVSLERAHQIHKTNG